MTLLTTSRYHEGSDSRQPFISASGYPHLLQRTFLTFNPQPQGAPVHRFVRHHSVAGDFQASPTPSRLAATPRRIGFAFATDHQFASGCSPPRFAATQLPLATGLWLTPMRTFTALIRAIMGALGASCARNRFQSPEQKTDTGLHRGHGYIASRAELALTLQLSVKFSLTSIR